MFKEYDFAKYSDILIFGILEGVVIFRGYPALHPYVQDFLATRPNISASELGSTSGASQFGKKP